MDEAVQGTGGGGVAATTFGFSTTGAAALGTGLGAGLGGVTTTGVLRKLVAHSPAIRNLFLFSTSIQHISSGIACRVLLD